MENITGKVVAVTGSSAGIGRAIAIKLAEKGATVVLGARNIGKLEELVAEIKESGGEASCIETDVKHKADLVRLVNTAVERYGRLDVLVNNAGVS